jgi:DNA mismatch repair protein MutS
VVPVADPAPPFSSLLDRLQALDPDAMSPREAHDILYELKRLADNR